jgi:hypothetical protein
MTTKDEIMSKVQEQAKIVLVTFVTNLGAKKVKILTSDPYPNAPLPDSCR